MSLSSNQILDKYMAFWEKRDHKIIPNVSLVPNVDSTLLFVNSGMFPIAPYLSGQPHPEGKRLANIQRCIRMTEKELAEIGDNRHTLMFQMLGNWSLGDYFKKEQIPWCMKLHVEEYGLDPNRLYVTVWAGDDLVPRDDEAIELWINSFKEYGVDAEFNENIEDIPKDLKAGKKHKIRIFPYGKSDNWWQRGEAPGELGGPSSEIFYDTGIIEREQKKYHINDDSGRFLEVGNNVFMQYKLDEKLNWKPLDQKNIDFGGGFERVVMCIQEKTDIFETDLYEPIIQKLEEFSGKSYKTKGKENEFTSSFRVIADHLRASVFLIADEVHPSNKDQGYILRRLIRRAIRFARNLEIEQNFTPVVADTIVTLYKEQYPHFNERIDAIYNEFEREEMKFRKTLTKGLKELEKIRGKGVEIDGKKAFWLYETFGFPLEMSLEELALKDEKKEIKIKKDFDSELETHQAKSRAGAERKFKGGLADHSTETTRLHTAHHILLAALRQVLGPHVHQRGSNITNERLRIDFSHDDKMTDEEKQEVEKIVNNIIDKNLIIERKVMPKDEAEKIGAEMEFGAEYGDLVTVYLIKDPETNEYFSREFCGGPHVDNTGELAKSGRFRISKEQSSSAGIRRIKAKLT